MFLGQAAYSWSGAGKGKAGLSPRSSQRTQRSANAALSECSPQRKWPSADAAFSERSPQRTQPSADQRDECHRDHHQRGCQHRADHHHLSMSQCTLTLQMHAPSNDALRHRDALTNLNHVAHVFNMSPNIATDKVSAVDSANYNDSGLPVAVLRFAFVGSAGARVFTSNDGRALPSANHSYL